MLKEIDYVNDEKAKPPYSYAALICLAMKVSISSTFYAHLLRQYFCANILQSQNVTREKLHKALLYKKFVSKMLMKLTQGHPEKDDPQSGGNLTNYV